MNERKTVHRPFIDLFADALRQCGVSCVDSFPPDVRNSAAKSAILNCVFSLEALANALVEELPHSKQIQEAMEKWRTLEKFDYYLNFHHAGNLKRGEREVQKIAQLLKLRNDFVHPKIVDFEDEVISEDTLERKEGFYDQLKISKSSNRWVYEDARKIIDYTAEFISWYFLRILKWDAGFSALTILSVCEHNGQIGLMIADETRDLLLVIRDEWDLNLDFIPFESFGEEHINIQYKKG